MKKNSTRTGISDRVWAFFISVKLTVVLLLCLAVTSVIGTLIPQNEDPALYFRQYGEIFYKLFSFLDIFDMYHSWWFQLLMAALFLNIIACSYHRLSTVWKIIINKSPSVNPSRFKKLTNRIEITIKKSDDGLYDRYRDILAKRFGYCKTEQKEDGFYIYAEKGRLTRLGVYVVHVSVLVLLIGGFIGSKFGFEGLVNIPEGQSVRHIRAKHNPQPIELGFTIRCDDFNVSFYDSGLPKEYRSTVTLIENQKPILTRDIIMNKPLRYRGINIFQHSWGKIPVERHPVADIESKKIRLNITNRHTRMTYTQELSIGESIALPEGQGIFMIKEYRADADFGGQNIGDALLCVMMVKDQGPVDVLLPLRYPNFDKMRGGHFVFFLANADDLLIADDTRPAFYTGLHITKDPGVWVVYSGFLLMIIGCYISFFMAHQQVYIEFARQGNKSRLLVAGISNKNKLGIEQQLKKLSEKLLKDE